ncbi:probable RNA-dependent RNA polymerase 3 isoform X2 [Beta vulgaris subsp. vulgaris]|uniref:probable RNA-dependent RNA polymerase 3 isoform X2 n=1 Tax=Beta vulgaris subsp. vulgaris TaxID=3555 RepID=UPI0025478859|nr:probable RNA-dependent RNA polymerase 3 isoform X2 [Beta vulgaris subsp. vulgaris]
MADFSKKFPLPPLVEELIKQICREQSQPPLDLNARKELASLGEDESINILNKIRRSKINKSFDGFIVYMAKELRANSSATPVKLESYSSPQIISVSPPSSEGSNYLSDSPTSSSSGSTNSFKEDGSVLSYFSDKLASMTSIRLNLFGFSKSHQTSREFLALEKLGFRRAFLVMSYIGGRKLENVASVRDIKSLIVESEKLTMGSFENLAWERYGDRYCLRKDRIKYRRWDSSGQYYMYHCHVHLDGSYCFKGPFLNNRTSLLQKILKEENVLIVKFVDEVNEKSKLTKSSRASFAAIEKVAREGIYFGQNCYRFFAFKDGGRGEKKDRTSSSVKCYFVNIDNFAQSYDIDKCIRKARSVFMHLDTLPSLSKYAARLELALSKTITLPINLDASDIHVEVISDIPCQLADGSAVIGEDGKPLIHTDGTGYISEDLAREFPGKIFKANMVQDHNFEICDVFDSDLKEIPSQSTELLPQRTIQVRPSMIKVYKDPESSHFLTVNSFEIVGTSGRPKKSYLSRYLVSLLHYGGVPTKFFTNILKNAIGDARTSLTDKRAALQVALESGDMDDDFTIARMVLSGIPLNEPYIQTRLGFLTNHQNKGLKEGKLPIGESFYLMGTADPTNTLDRGEVCIIHENGQISGKVLVYRNPGIHFGDVHVLTAKHVEGLEEIVGNSKYGIFFPTKGSRSLADAMSGGDLDGDMYWVSRNLDLLKYFKPSHPWTCTNHSSSPQQKKPVDFSDEELEHELFSRFLSARFQPSKAMGIASNSWLAHMDQLLTLGDKDVTERKRLKEKMLKLVDIYYEALDAPKTGIEVTVPRELVADTYPHYMGRQPSSSYHSESVLGKIYDEAHEWALETPSIPVWKLSLLDVEVPKKNLKTWQRLYKNYRVEMSAAVSNGDEELKRESCDKVIQKYKQILYEAADLESSSRAWVETRFDALAIYHVSYDYAMEIEDAKKCGFAWKVAGMALLKIFAEAQAEKPIACMPSVLQEVLTRKSAQEQM